MKEEREDSPHSSRQPLPGFTSSRTPTNTDPLRDPSFTSLEEDAFDTYDEPDRDRDIATGFREERFEEEDEAFDDLLPEELQADEALLFREQSEFLRSERGRLEAQPASKDRNIEWDEEEDEPPGRWGQETADEEEEEDWRDAQAEINTWQEDDSGDTGVANDWTDDEEEYAVEEDEQSGGWPLGLIAVGIIALLLVVAGGYGIVQQRAATQEEIVELRAALATAVSPQEVTASRAALQEANERNFELAAQAETLVRENQRLRDTVAGLEAQIQARQATPDTAGAATEATPASEPAAPQPAEEKQTAPATASSAAAASGDWFVNFGSYGQRSAAEQWISRLKPGAGSVIVAEGTRNGNTFYRVRVVGLADRAAADGVARKLEKDWGLPKLWVGSE